MATAIKYQLRKERLMMSLSTNPMVDTKTTGPDDQTGINVFQMTNVSKHITSSKTDSAKQWTEHSRNMSPSLTSAF